MFVVGVRLHANSGAVTACIVESWQLIVCQDVWTVLCGGEVLDPYSSTVGCACIVCRLGLIW